MSRRAALRVRSLGRRRCCRVANERAGECECEFGFVCEQLARLLERLLLLLLPPPLLERRREEAAASGGSRASKATRATAKATGCSKATSRTPASEPRSNERASKPTNERAKKQMASTNAACFSYQSLHQ